MATNRSKGPGTVLLILVLLLAVAGGSAWFIHKILTGGEPTVTNDPSGTVPGNQGSGTGQRNLPVQMAGQPGTQPGSQLGQPSIPPITSPSGGATPGATPANQDGTASDEFGQSSSEGLGDGVPSPAQNLLLVPGAIEIPAPSAREDAVVRPAFVTDIARFLVRNYWPKGSHPSATRSGITTASLRWANLRYGAELQGLEGRRSDPAKARSAILDYILSPAAVSRIYALYADGFVDALLAEGGKRTVGEGAQKRPLTARETKEMVSIYASYASRVASALEKYAAAPAMSGKVEKFVHAEQAAQEGNRMYMESMLAFEEAVETGARPAIGVARLRRDKDAATYQKRIRERETAREALVAAMSHDNNPRSSSADTLVYVAFWAYRRGPDSAPALRSCAKTLNDMGVKLGAKARQMP